MTKKENASSLLILDLAAKLSRTNYSTVYMALHTTLLLKFSSKMVMTTLLMCGVLVLLCTSYSQANLHSMDKLVVKSYLRSKWVNTLWMAVFGIASQLKPRT